VFHPSLEETHCFKKCCSKESTKPLSFEDLKTIEDNDVHLHLTNLQKNLQYSSTTNSMVINIIHSQSREHLKISPIYEYRMEKSSKSFNSKQHIPTSNFQKIHTNAM
jgi:hypothetical protein